MAGVVQADKGLTGVSFLVDCQQFLGAGNARGAEVDGLQDAAIERQKLGGEAELALLETARSAALREHGGVSGWSRPRRFSVTSQKLVLRLGLRPAPLTPDLASQTMPAARSIDAGFDQRADGQVGGRRVAARVGDQARAGDRGRGRIPAARRPPRPAVRAGCAALYTRRCSFRGCAGGKRRRGRPRARPAASMAGASSIETSGGVARKTSASPSGSNHFGVTRQAPRAGRVAQG